MPLLPVRARDDVLREREAAPDALAAPVLRLAEVRLAPEPAALAPVDLAAPDLARVAVARELLALALVAVLRVPVARLVVVLERPLAPVLLLALPRDDPDEPLDPSSELHLPDITRCAASATASAMIDPSRVALDIMLLAACEAVSAASSPASRILRRAAGLALIAAAAAARPAASISLLIAALASLSTVSLFLLDEEREEPFRADFAIVYLPRCGEDTSKP